MNPSQQTSLQVLDTLDLLVRHWNRADIPAILSHADPSCSGFDPWGREQILGHDQLRTFLERATGRLQGLGFTDVQIEAIGTIAWVSGLFHSSSDDSPFNLQGRFTAVLKGTGHAWVLVHLHLSFPDAGQAQ